MLDIVFQRAFVMFTPVEDQAWGWPGIPQLACTCKTAALGLKAARHELTPAHLAALNRERGFHEAVYYGGRDKESTDE